MTTNDVNYQLEEIIDKIGIDGVLAKLALICQEKAEHLLTNWQDKPAADWWEHAAELIDSIQIGEI